jgi:hypothetical protein
MSKSPSSKTTLVDLHGYLFSILPLVALTTLVACGGGGASFRQIGGGGGGGGGGGNGAPCALQAPSSSSPTATLGLVQPATTNAFMDLHVGNPTLLTNGSVSVPYGSLRLWDTGTGWAQINSSPGVYDFSANLDGFVSAAPSGVDLLYNLARTPNWASSNPGDSSCAYNTNDFPNGGGNGQCWAPKDLNNDGSGTDQDWINWVTAVAQRNAGQYGNKIKYFEIWNEWNIPKFWQGTPAQLARMEQDARCIVGGPPLGFTCKENGSVFPSGMGINAAAKIVTPSPVGAFQNDLNSVATNLSDFFGTKVGGIGGGTFSDVIGFHGYVGTTASSGVCPSPEDVNTVVDDLNNTVLSFPTEAALKPWFNTEGGWSKASEEGFTDPHRQAAFLARYFLLQRSLGVDRVYWYRWDATNTYGGALWTSSGGPTEAASAWSEVNHWIIGKTLISACTANTPGGGSTVWSCGLTSGAWKGLAVWDAGQDCTTTSCPTSSFTVPAGGYTEYLDLAGNKNTVSGGTVPVGAKPILLENGTLP